mgnify:CR=1 FL=1
MLNIKHVLSDKLELPAKVWESDASVGPYFVYVSENLYHLWHVFSTLSFFEGSPVEKEPKTAHTRYAGTSCNTGFIKEIPFRATCS